ncbi:hypothetical protein BG015_010831 [Linnemannia schmuckeri]|uniref:intramembrane prenyl-peptidase Rce1 n=1 Tax=Linnemannia schmuckeri TaxID=64567 RepID=A0A9P5S9T4_9FUNG|nr:hypothetical protein BG015_010831 [Linnemannia schmuckeri]
MLPFQSVIPPWVAGCSCVFFASLFVGSLYLFPVKKQAPTGIHASDRSQQRLDRDHPLVIKQRIKGIIFTSVSVTIYLWAPTSSRVHAFLQLLGLTVPAYGLVQWLHHIFTPMVLVAMLFLGPLVMMLIDSELPFQSRFYWRNHLQSFCEWIGVRNYIVGPIAEEYIFRACMVSITAMSGASPKAMIFGLPLVFGIAHLHHGYESFVKKGRTRQAAIQSAIIALVQLTYTSLFGWFATFLFLRTSSLLAPCLCHSFCNLMGFPDVSNIQYYGRWKVWIYVAFGLGIVLFAGMLESLTSPSLYGSTYTSVYWMK